MPNRMMTIKEMDEELRKIGHKHNVKFAEAMLEKYSKLPTRKKVGAKPTKEAE